MARQVISSFAMLDAMLCRDTWCNALPCMAPPAVLRKATRRAMPREAAHRQRSLRVYATPPPPARGRAPGVRSACLRASGLCGCRHTCLSEHCNTTVIDLDLRLCSTTLICTLLSVEISREGELCDATRLKHANLTLIIAIGDAAVQSRILMRKATPAGPACDGMLLTMLP